MKFWMSFMIMTAMAVYANAITLRLPLIEEKTKSTKNGNRYSYPLLNKRNAALKAKGSDIQFPKYIEFSSAKEGDDKLAKIEKEVEAANKILGDEFEVVRYGALSTYTQSKLGYRMCYSDADARSENSVAKSVARAIVKIAGSLLSEQESVYGSRYKKEGMWLDDGVKEEDQEDWPENWVDWRGNGEAVAVLNSDNDGGDNLSADIVRSCAREDARGQKPPKRRPRPNPKALD